MDGPGRDAEPAGLSLSGALSAPARTMAVALLARCAFPAAPAAVTCAVSGGADSLALLLLARCAGLAVTAVHIDHGLRPGSDAEAAVVRDAAARFGASFEAHAVRVGDGPNLEARARAARRALLPPDAMTGHTAEDRAETLLLNLLRGAGPTGLAALGPSPRRPILALRRAECAALVAAAGLEPVRDPSNADPRFRRNRIRHELLPLLDAIAERDVVPLLVRAAGHQHDVERYLAEQAAGVDPRDSAALRALPEPVAVAALRGWLRPFLPGGQPPDAATVARVLDVVHLRRRATELPGGRRLLRRDGTLRVE